MFKLLPRIVHNVVQGPVTRNFPEEARPAFELARGTIHFEMDGCKFCGLCAMKCPANAIHVDRTAKELVFEPFRCVSCNACVEACRFGCVQMDCEYRHPAEAKPREVHREVPKSPVSAEDAEAKAS